MKKKIIGILVLTLLIATTVLPALGTFNIGKIQKRGMSISSLENEEDGLQTNSINENSMNDEDWLPIYSTNTDPIYHLGNVGIGVEEPEAKLHVAESDVSNTPLFERSNRQDNVPWTTIRILATAKGSMGDGFGPALGFYIRGGSGLTNIIGHIWAERSGDDDTTGDIHIVPMNSGNKVENALVVTHTGNVGIGTGNPNPNRNLHIKDDQSYIQFDNTKGNDNYVIGSDLIGGFIIYSEDDDAYRMVFDNEGNVGIGVNVPEEKLHVDGAIKLSGGSDIAEPFNVKEKEMVEPGMIVVIDAENPGNLKISDKPYDRCVAGVISGAGGINPGLILTQDDVFDGTHQVALAGRVYGYCDASYGAIEPGDLLTTSYTSGYAMKVTDYEQAKGAILGKAMTSLETEKGLVLILVSLQ